jgi:hypothetical protein
VSSSLLESQCQGPAGEFDQTRKVFQVASTILVYGGSCCIQWGSSKPKGSWASSSGVMARSSACVIQRELGKAALEAIQLGDPPTGSSPRIGDRKGGFKVWSVWSVALAVSFDPVVFFGDPLVKEDRGVSPKKVFKVEGACSDLMAFV